MRIKLPTILAALLVFAACGDGTGPTTGAQVSLTFASVTAGGAPAPTFAGPMAVPIMDESGNTLEIETVLVVLREIELERVEVAECDDVEPEPDGCEKFETGPVLVDFQQVGSTSLSQDIAIIMIPPGTYDEIEFDIHKVSDDDPEDEAFLIAHPELEGKSIVVTGTFNGEDFVYETDLNEDQEFAIDLVVGQDETTNVTVQFDVSTWFVDGAGNLFNPTSALKGGPNENLAEDNIENSIEAFEDEDEDGHHDDGHHDDD
jgi:hypothetical protein